MGVLILIAREPMPHLTRNAAALLFMGICIIAPFSMNRTMRAKSKFVRVGGVIFFLIALMMTIILSGCASLPRGPKETKSIIDERFTGREDGLVERIRFQWSDVAFTRGWYFLTDPSATALSGTHTNMPELGGSSTIEVGSPKIVVDPQTGAIIGATGTAVGNVIGATVKTIVK
jgi:hypothetical protein